MNKTKFYGCLGVLALAGTMFTACSDDDNNGGNENSSAAVWTCLLYTSDAADE